MGGRPITLSLQLELSWVDLGCENMKNFPSERINTLKRGWTKVESCEKGDLGRNEGLLVFRKFRGAKIFCYEYFVFISE